jgi:hypothetical protein
MTFHTFIYCTVHDDGYILESELESTDIPKDYKCAGVDCDSYCEFIFCGQLYFNGKEIKEIVPVQKNYDKYGGGFKFEYYKTNKLIKI